jgi:hypothetical protein
MFQLIWRRCETEIDYKVSLNGSFIEDFAGINYHVTSSFLLNVARYLWGERSESFIICEGSVIIMKLMWHGYLVPNLGNYAMKLYTETGLEDLEESCHTIQWKNRLEWWPLGKKGKRNHTKLYNRYHSLKPRPSTSSVDVIVTQFPHPRSHVSIHFSALLFLDSACKWKRQLNSRQW